MTQINFKCNQPIEFWNDFTNRWESGWYFVSKTGSLAIIKNNEVQAIVDSVLIRTTAASFIWQLDPWKIDVNSFSKSYFQMPSYSITSKDWALTNEPWPGSYKKSPVVK
jgi:hypothetical protein